MLSSRITPLNMSEMGLLRTLMTLRNQIAYKCMTVYASSVFFELTKCREERFRSIPVILEDEVSECRAPNDSILDIDVP